MKFFCSLFILTASFFIFAKDGLAGVKKGGVYTMNLQGEPTTLHPITSTDHYATDVHSYTMDTLLEKDLDSLDWKPRLAEKWEISKDGKIFTFWLRKNAFFHDGTPVTAEDVKFSFDAIFDNKYQAAHRRPYYENLEKVEVVDGSTVKFYVKNLYFLNFDTAAELSVIPKHIYSDTEKSMKMTRELVGAGPYIVSKLDRGQKLVLKKFAKWYGDQDSSLKDQYNFETINMRFVKEENVALEMLKKGELDFSLLKAEQYAKRTEGPPFGKTVLKFKEKLKAPNQYGFIGWNLRLLLFQDRKVRLALYHLLNRREMIKKFRFGLSEPATGPLDLVSDYASKDVKPVEFDPQKAKELLTEAGWKDSDKNGILDKEREGKKTEFKFTLTFANKDFEKYLTLYKEDLKKAGIEMELKLLEWNSFIKILDEGKFESVVLAWVHPIEWDPKQIWHSTSAVAGGSNFINYKNPEVDKLIDDARVELDRKKRISMLRKVYEAIAADVPYAFFFNDSNRYYANSSRIKKSKNSFAYGIGEQYWWAE